MKESWPNAKKNSKDAVIKAAIGLTLGIPAVGAMIGRDYTPEEGNDKDGLTKNKIELSEEVSEKIPDKTIAFNKEEKK